MRKGEKGTGIVYADKITKKDTAEDGEEQERQIYFLKTYVVFNTEQIDGLPEQYYVKPVPLPLAFQRIEAAEAFFARITADVQHGGNRTFYAPAPDFIQLPPFEAFKHAVIATQPSTRPCAATSIGRRVVVVEPQNQFKKLKNKLYKLEELA